MGATSWGLCVSSETEFVSVIIPARNVEQYIRQTISSVLSQTYATFEIVVVDDGSTDGTAAIIEAIARGDQRVRLIRTEKIGVSAARNLAISHAGGTLIAPLDADDIWHVEKLARQLAVLRAADSRVGLVYCWSSGIDEQGRVILPSWNSSQIHGDVLRDIIVSGIAGNGSTPLIRREFIDIVGGYDETLSLCEDWKFYTALAGVCDFEVVPEYLTGYRLRAGSASLDVCQMERAIEDVTAWIRSQWHWVSGDLMLDRSYTVDAYLAVLAVRQRKFANAARLLLSAAQARPNKVLASSYLRLWALWVAHAVGIRVYRWQFWKRPLFDVYRPLSGWG